MVKMAFRAANEAINAKRKIASYPQDATQQKVTKDKNMAWNVDLDKINPTRIYRFCEIRDEIGISTQTLWLWRKQGRLSVVKSNRSMVKGEWLKEAILNRRAVA